MREAAVNALIHRDYAALGEIQIRVYDDRFDIWSPGGLPEGVSLDDLRHEGHISKLRNPLLAQLFYYAGLVERWGTGTTRIIAACRSHGLPDPEFSEESGRFRLVIRKDRYTRDRFLALGINERQVQAMLYVKEKGSITNREYQTLTGASERTSLRELSVLVRQGLLQRLGTTGRAITYAPPQTQNGP